MNNWDFKEKVLYNREPEEEITLSGEKYILYWTPHAQERVQNRMRSSLLIQNVYLGDMLTKIADNKDIDVFKRNCEFTIRDFQTGLFTVINVDRNSKKIRVITCADVFALYPKNNDLVIQRNEDGEIKQYIWTVLN